MAKIYVSSTIADLAAERQAVMEWLVAAGHQPVHSYRPDSETVRESCIRDIDECDLYVLILGHRYGFQPDERNPDGLSITHIEFRRAKQSRVARIALLRTSVSDIRLSDLLDPNRASLVRGFDAEVRREVRPAEFVDLKGLIQGLSTGVQSELGKLATPNIAADNPRVLQIATLIDEIGRKNRQLDDKDAEIVRLNRENEELRRGAIARTLTAAAQPDASQAALAAADALAGGDTGPAEGLLHAEEQAEVAQIGSPQADDTLLRRQAAQLAREQGALAIGHDVRTALEAYQRAAEYEPDDYWPHFLIGDLQLRLGTSGAATQSYLRGAAASKRRVRANPNDLDGQRGLSVSHIKIGNVLVAQGDEPGALAAYRKGLAIAEVLAACDTANTEWQRDLSVSHIKIGDVLRAQGDGAGALAAYRKSLAISETLAARDLADIDWQRDLSVSHDRIGDVHRAQDDGAGALAAYRKALAISEMLAARDPANTVWQRDLSVSHGKIGGVLGAQDDELEALAAYRRGVAIAEALAARDPANALWQNDVAVSCSRLGTLEHGHDLDARRGYLLRGREILVQLKEAGRLMPDQDWIGWLDRQIGRLEQ